MTAGLTISRTASPVRPPVDCLTPIRNVDALTPNGSQRGGVGDGGLAGRIVASPQTKASCSPIFLPLLRQLKYTEGASGPLMA